MPRFSEETLISWTKPASDSEETKLENARRMVIQCIENDPKLMEMGIDIFGQGSYANDTNVRLNSDIDINVCYNEAFHFDLPVGTQREDFGFDGGVTYSFSEYKNDVENALVKYFGRNEVIRNNKCITIKANSYRVETDVVPTWQYRNYWADKSYYKGVYFQADSGEIIKSYPLKHIENGKQKNSQTLRRYKRLTRIFKKIRYHMIANGVNVSDHITSFLLECLVWNVPNHVFNNNITWEARLRAAIVHLYESTEDGSKCEKWGEVSECFVLIS
jgi:hypothetical protein